MALINWNLGLSEIIRLPYFWTADEILAYLTLINNDEKPNKDLIKLDDFNFSLKGKNCPSVCTDDWIKKLQQLHEIDEATGLESPISHFDDLLDGCRPKLKNSYLATPSELIRLIRNCEQHAPEKMKKGTNQLLARLYANSYEVKRGYICYWLETFPRLIPAVWATKERKEDLFDWGQPSLVDQIVDGVWSAIRHETNSGNLVARYKCSNNIDQRSFSVTVIETELDEERYNKLRGTVIKVHNNEMAVLRAKETITYKLRVRQPKNLTLTVGNLTFSSISDNVVVLTNSNIQLTQVNDTLSKFAVTEQNPVKWLEISELVRNQITNSISVSIQNRKYSLDQLGVGESSLEALEGSKLNMLIKTHNLEVCSINKKLNSEYYINRFIETRVIHPEFFEITDPHQVVYVILNVSRRSRFLLAHKIGRKPLFVRLGKESSLHGLSSNIVAVHPRNDIYLVCKRVSELAPKATQHLLHYDRDDWCLVSIMNDKVNNIKQLFNERAYMEELQKQRLQLISGSPGVGKSTLLMNLYENSNIHNNNVTALVTARDFMRDISKSTAGFSAESLQDLVIGYIAKDSFEIGLVKRLLANGFTFTLLIDALDECKARDKGQLEKLLFRLVNFDNFRIVATVRTYCEMYYRDLYNVPVNKLHEISYQDGLLIIEELINSVKNADSSKSDDYVWPRSSGREILQKLRSTKNLPFTPMVVKMYVEIFLEELASIGPGSYSNENLMNKVNINIVVLVEKVVEKNFTIYLSGKKRVQEVDVDDDIYEMLIKPQYIGSHQLLALLELYPDFKEFFLSVINSNTDLTPGQGFVDSVTPPKFMHRTFADYFADLWCVHVLTGKYNLSSEQVDTFTEFFWERYIHTTGHQFIYIMLGRLENVSYPFNFDLVTDVGAEENEISDYMKMAAEESLHVGRLVLDSVCDHRADLLAPLLEEKTGIEIEILELIFNKKYTILNASAVLGLYKLFEKIFRSLSKDNQLFYFLSYDCAKLFHTLAFGAAQESNSTRRNKEQIVQFMVTENPDMADDSDKLGNKPFMYKTISYELFRCFGRLGNELTCSNNCKNNVLHIRCEDDMFWKQFIEDFPLQFYCCVNSINGNGDTPFWIHRFIRKSRNVQPIKLVNIDNALNIIDFNTGILDSGPAWLRNFKRLRLNGWKNINEELEYMRVILRASFCIPHMGQHMLQYFYKNFNNNLIREIIKNIEWDSQVDTNLTFLVKLLEFIFQKSNVWDNIITHGFTSVLQMYTVSAMNSSEHEIAEMVRLFPDLEGKYQMVDYYVALHVRDSLKANPHCPELQNYFIDKVLECEGTRFRHTMVCYLLNEMLFEEPDVQFKVHKSMSSYFRKNDSPFIVACKSGHVNIARLLAQTLDIQWIRCLSSFELSLLFRALVQHCGDLIDFVADRLQENSYKVPASVVREALGYGCLKLVQIFVEKLGCSVEKWGEIDPKRGNGMIHLAIECVSDELESELNRRKLLIDYLARVPGALEHRNQLGRTPLLHDNVPETLSRYLIAIGANVRATDMNQNNALHVYFQNWKNQYRNTLVNDLAQDKYYRHIIHLSSVMGLAIHDLNFEELRPIQIRFLSENDIPPRWKEKLEAAGFHACQLVRSSTSIPDFDPPPVDIMTSYPNHDESNNVDDSADECSSDEEPNYDELLARVPELKRALWVIDNSCNSCNKRRGKDLRKPEEGNVYTHMNTVLNTIFQLHS